MKIQPYLFFEGRCDEALKFYRDRIGANVGRIMRYSESPTPPPPGMAPMPGDKIMHTYFTVGDSEIMASDGHCSGQPDFKGVSLTLMTPDADDARRKFDALADDGQPFLPMHETFFSPAFGMLKDRFGVNWIVMCAPEPPA